MFGLPQVPGFVMAKTALCTISTRSHIFKSKVLLESARRYTQADLFCLLTDTVELPSALCGETYHTLDVLQGETAAAIKRKYKGNKLRWACKSLYLMHLLDAGYEKVVYVDNDICFFSSADFLYERLENASVLLTPHHYPFDPIDKPNWLEANFRVGLYNAGFVGVSTKGRKAMEWWAGCCLYNVKQSAWRGLFDDQKYLDLLPIIFEGVEVTSHKGCNVAGWNLDVSRRVKNAEGEATIDGKWPIVFIHFAATTFRQVLAGNDTALAPYLQRYTQALQTQNPSYSEQRELVRKTSDYLLYLRYILWRITRALE